MATRSNGGGSLGLLLFAPVWIPLALMTAWWWLPPFVALWVILAFRQHRTCAHCRRWSAPLNVTSYAGTVTHSTECRRCGHRTPKF